MSDLAPAASSHALELVRAYLRALETDADEAHIASFFRLDVEQREHPNRLVERGVTRNLAELIAGYRKGRAVVQDQRFELKSAVVDGERVAVEVSWSARVKVPLGKLAPGDTMRAESAMFFRIVGGRIAEQRNFDCFEPF